MALATEHYRGRDFAVARRLCREVLAKNPDEAKAFVLLGDMAQQEGRNNQAIRFLNEALELDPQSVAAHDTVAIAYQAVGRRGDSIAHFEQAIALGLSDAETLVKNGPGVASLLRSRAGFSSEHLSPADLGGADDAGQMGRETLLIALLRSRPVFDIELERLFAALRRGLLRAAIKEASKELDCDTLAFYCALAEQCFINEYVYEVSDIELQQLQKIHDAVSDAAACGREVAPVDLVVLASYMPLHRLAMPSFLLQRPWPEAVAHLLTQQICEPLEEKSDVSRIPALNVIDDFTSLKVKEQYEENPYPRWVTYPSIKPTTITNYLSNTLELSAGDLPNSIRDILVAGCGTGFHSIETAQLFPASHILAIDISRASLAYARRKTRVLGISNIEYWQGDILKLGTLERDFDVIETVGVLHHLSDPQAGWRVLLSKLRPRGLMLVGLYSALAHKALAKAREIILARGLSPAIEDIRSCRQILMQRGEVPAYRDFWTTSGCRDLLFNVMEREFTIPQIKAFLAANQLNFLGFEQLPAGVPETFRRKFPDAAAVRDLDTWHAFELMHPHTFRNMYIFWVQKAE